MKRLSVSVLAALLTTSLALVAAAQEGRRRSLEGFDAVEVSGGIDVDLRQGRTFAVEITEGDPNEIVTEVRGRTLVIRPARSFGRLFDWDGDDGTVRVTLPELKALLASGGSDLRLTGRARRAAVQSSGGSDIVYSGEPRTVNMETSGGSGVRRR